MIRNHGSVLKALVDLFPEINWEEHKGIKIKVFCYLQYFNLLIFTHVEGSQSSWNDATKRQQFFINFAHENNFDPFVPSNWRNMSRKIKATKVFILFYYFYYFYLFSFFRIVQLFYVTIMALVFVKH